MRAQQLASALPLRVERGVVEISRRIDAGAADREAIERVEPVQRSALGARTDERHDRHAPAGVKHLERSIQSSREIVNRPVAPDRHERVRGLDALELYGVPAHELDVAPAVPL